MPLFAYIALKNNKTIVRGKLEADDIKSAREGIKKLGLLPTKIVDETKTKVSWKRNFCLCYRLWTSSEDTYILFGLSFLSLGLQPAVKPAEEESLPHYSVLRF